MSPRGRKAVLPAGEPPRRPPTKVPGSLLVEHRDKAGRIARYDFAKLPCEAPMKATLAALFAARCTREGGWNSHDSSRNCWYQLRTFATWLSGRTPVIADVDELTAGVWKEYRLSRSTGAVGYSQLTVVARILRKDPRVTQAAREEIDRRVPVVKPKEQSFAPDEFRQITVAARRVFRAAHLRILENAAVLETWRAGGIQEGSNEWLVGEALDCVARTGDVPSYHGPLGRRRVINRYKRPLGGESALARWGRLFLSRHEATALGVLFTVEHGLNLSVVSGLAVPRATPDPGENGFPVYRIELEKQRRDGKRHFETRNFADFGADSPGRLITQALEATAFARALVQELNPEVDRLMIWREIKPAQQDMKVGAFGLGVTKDAAHDWAKGEGLSASPFRRGRRTANVQHRREPGQNSQDTHDSVYVLRDEQAQEGAVDDIAAGATAAVDTARSTVLVAELRDKADPEDKATATADCHDNQHSHFTEHGIACRASFLMCLACPNARIHPGHHARLAHLYQALESLHSALEPARWDSDWSDTHGRLEHLKSELGLPLWEAALSDVTDLDREIIDHLLKGDFDQ